MDWIVANSLPSIAFRPHSDLDRFRGQKFGFGGVNASVIFLRWQCILLASGIFPKEPIDQVQVRIVRLGRREAQAAALQDREPG